MQRFGSTVAMVSLVTFGSAVAQADGRNPEELTVALLPDENASELIQRNKPLEEYLEEELGREIELQVLSDYSAMIQAMRFGRIDLGYFGPISGMLAAAKGDVEFFAAPVVNGRPEYRGVIIGNVPQGIDEVEDARGETVAYGDPASTSSHLMPRAKLQDDYGMVAGEDYTREHTGAHDAVAKAVENGNAQLGGLGEHIWNYLVEDERIDTDQVQVVDYTPYYPQYPWVMQSDLDEELKASIREAFLALDDEEILGNFQAEAFVATDLSDYEIYRDMSTTIGIDFEDL